MQVTVLTKVSIRRLGIYTLPLSAPLTQGGRIMTAAGELAQLVNGEAFRHLAYLEFADKPAIARGNHYHRSKDEYLYVLRGRLQATLQDITTHERATVIVETGDLVRIQPGCAHVYRPLSYTQALEFAPTPFDPGDTYSYVLE